MRTQWWSLGLVLLMALMGPLGLAVSAPGPDAATAAHAEAAPDPDPSAIAYGLPDGPAVPCDKADPEAIMGLLTLPHDPLGTTLTQGQLADVGARGWPDDVPSSDLFRIYDALEHLPGFVDVHMILVGEPAFEVLFDGPVPALPALDAPYPVVGLDISGAVTADRFVAPTDGNAAPDFFPQACPNSIHPGQQFGSCTVSWVLRDSQDRLYIATAGHCVGSVGSRFYQHGQVVFKMNNGVGKDFALVRIDDDKRDWVDPSMCHWGGPTGIADRGGMGNLLRQVGYGDVLGDMDATRPRSGMLRGMGVESYSYWAPVMPGDSGSPVRLTDGLAVGVHTHGVTLGGTPLKFGTTLERGLLFANHALGDQLQLVTAPVSENDPMRWPDYVPTPEPPQAALVAPAEV